MILNGVVLVGSVKTFSANQNKKCHSNLWLDIVRKFDGLLSYIVIFKMKIVNQMKLIGKGVVLHRERVIL